MCRKRSPYLRNNFGKSLEIFGKWSEIFGKSSKTSSLVCLCNKQNITCQLVDMNFIFSSSTRHLTSSLRSLVRYRVEHSKIKFISTRGHVISFIYLITLEKATKRILSFANLIFSSCRFRTQSAKKATLRFAILSCTVKLWNVFEIVLEKCEVFLATKITLIEKIFRKKKFR